MRYFTTAMAATAMVLTGLLAAPLAQADASDYIWHLENNKHVDFTGNKGAYLDLGFAICDDLADGFSTQQIASDIYNYNPYFDFDYTAAEEVVYVARDFLC